MPYTAGDVLVRAVMTSFTGLPQDDIVNDFAFKALVAPLPIDLTNMFAAVDEFYRTLTSSGNAVSQLISPFVSRAATHKLQAYSITAAGTGSPIREDAWLGPVAAIENEGLPSECAAVLSFHADLTGVLEEAGATRPKARRRGRVYIGPLCPFAVDVGNPPYFLTAQTRATLNAAAVRLKDSAAADNVPWQVWSRVDQQLRPVVAGWTDNAPDTQRRRGATSTARVVWGP